MKTKLLTTFWLALLSVLGFAQVTQINSNQSLEPITNLNSVKTLFSSEIDGTLWVSEGTLASTQQLNNSISYSASGALLGSKFIFTGFSAATGIELFITDGTPAGTMLLKDIVAGIAASSPSELTSLNGMVYFTAETPAEGRELWRTDGTPGGTILVKDINPGPTESNSLSSYGLTPLGNNIIFSAKGNANGTELWKTDGTPGGTVMIKDINLGIEDSNPGFFWRLNNLIIFAAKTAANGTEFWRTDGTEAGTFLLKDINPGTGSSAFAEIEVAPGVFIPFPFIGGINVFNGKAYFQANDGTGSGNIFSTDGTTANTQLVKTVVPGPALPFFLLFNAINLSGKFIFTVGDETNVSLWQSDGTTNGTTVFKSFFLNNKPDFPILYKDYSNYFDGSDPGNTNTPLFQGTKFFFAAPTEAEGNELWISDGTLGGTSLVKNIGPGATSGISEFSYLNTTSGLYFTANNSTNGIELWRSDGTSDGTTMVQDINPGAPDATPLLTIINNGKIYFTANDGDDPTKTDLYVVNGNFTPLPALLVDFSVTRQHADALLTWETLQEVNISNYIIERSINAVDFQIIGTVTANNRFNQHYQFIDYKIVIPPSGKLFYRLVTNDKDGAKSYSKVVTLSGKTVSWDAKLLSNGFGSGTRLQIIGEQKPFSIRVTDQAGKIMYTKQCSGYDNYINLPMTSLSKGLYHVTIYYGNETKTLRLIW